MIILKYMIKSNLLDLIIVIEYFIIYEYIHNVMFYLNKTLCYVDINI